MWVHLTVSTRIEWRHLQHSLVVITRVLSIALTALWLGVLFSMLGNVHGEHIIFLLYETHREIIFLEIAVVIAIVALTIRNFRAKI